MPNMIKERFAQEVEIAGTCMQALDEYDGEGFNITDDEEEFDFEGEQFELELGQA